MPDLPVITLPQAQYDKVVSIFPGATAAEKADAYRNWTINRLIDQVERDEQVKAQLAIQASLPARLPEPFTYDSITTSRVFS